MGIATLVIDMQVDFFSHVRLARHRTDLAVAINALTTATREGGGTVIWVRQVFSPDLSDATIEVRRNNLHIVVDGTPGADLLPELTVHESDRSIIKKRYSAFFGTGLDALLDSIGCTRLVVAGVNTHACVRTTVIDAYQRDFDVILAREAIDSHDAEHHDISWRYMAGKFAQAMDIAEIRTALAIEARKSD